MNTPEIIGAVLTAACVAAIIYIYIKAGKPSVLCAKCRGWGFSHAAKTCNHCNGTGFTQ